jgi:arsenate reductase
MITIYHNPRCSKSREGLQALELLGKDFTIVKYLDQTLTREELLAIIQKLGIKPIELVRTKEALWTAHYKGKQLTDDEFVDVLLTYPQIIERPVVVNGNKAVIARPVEKIKSIL